MLTRSARCQRFFRCWIARWILHHTLESHTTTSARHAMATTPHPVSQPRDTRMVTELRVMPEANAEKATSNVFGESNAPGKGLNSTVWCDFSVLLSALGVSADGGLELWTSAPSERFGALEDVGGQPGGGSFTLRLVRTSPVGDKLDTSNSALSSLTMAAGST